MIQDILIKAMISYLREHLLELFSFSIKCVARRGCDIFTHKSQNEEDASFFYLYFEKKKQVLLKSKSLSLKLIEFYSGF